MECGWGKPQRQCLGWQKIRDDGQSVDALPEFWHALDERLGVRVFGGREDIVRGA